MDREINQKTDQELNNLASEVREETARRKESKLKIARERALASKAADKIWIAVAKYNKEKLLELMYGDDDLEQVRERFRDSYFEELDWHDLLELAKKVLSEEEYEALEHESYDL